MNTTKARCGHAVPAEGAPGSAARLACEQNLCPRCANERLNMNETPADYDTPDWSDEHRVHNWRNYITEEVQAMWHTFTDEQKRALARQAQAQADNEEWE